MMGGMGGMNLGGEDSDDDLPDLDARCRPRARTRVIRRARLQLRLPPRPWRRPRARAVEESVEEAAFEMHEHYLFAQRRCSGTRPRARTAARNAGAREPKAWEFAPRPGSR